MSRAAPSAVKAFVFCDDGDFLICVYLRKSVAKGSIFLHASAACFCLSSAFSASSAVKISSRQNCQTSRDIKKRKRNFLSFAPFAVQSQLEAQHNATAGHQIVVME